VSALDAAATDADPHGTASAATLLDEAIV